MFISELVESYFPQEITIICSNENSSLPLFSLYHRSISLTVSWTKRGRKKQLSPAMVANYVTITCPLVPGSPNALADSLLHMSSNSSWLWFWPTLTWNYWTLPLKCRLLTSLALVWESSSLYMMWTLGTSWDQTTRLCLSSRGIQARIVNTVYLLYI